MTADKQTDWRQDPVARLERKNAFDGSLVMGTAAFNRSTGRLTSKDKPFYWAIDPETGLVRSDLTRARSCPVCDSPPQRGLFVKDGFRHVLCPQCGTIYVSLILREDVSEKFWREEMAWMGVLNSSPQMEIDRLKYQYGLDLVQDRTPGKKLLDVGSGPGGFVRLAESQGWEASALELNLESSQKLVDDGFDVIVKQLEMADLPDATFDLIAMWEVLEHLAEPKPTLSELKRLLSPGGLLLILVPNAGSLVSRLLHEKSNTFGGHSHLNHFNAASLTRLVEHYGFVVEELETIITELGTINNYLAYDDPYSGEAKAFSDILTPQLIHENLWGSRLLLIARKPDNK